MTTRRVTLRERFENRTRDNSLLCIRGAEAEFYAHRCTPSRGNYLDKPLCAWWTSSEGRQCALRWERPDGSIPRKLAEMIWGVNVEWRLIDTDNDGVEWVSGDGWRNPEE